MPSPAPNENACSEQRQPDIGIKEIRCVHRFGVGNFDFGTLGTISGKRTSFAFGRRPANKVACTPARISSRTERPCAAACSLSRRYRGAGMSTVVRTASGFMLAFSHECHKYGRSFRWVCNPLASTSPNRFTQCLSRQTDVSAT